MKLFKGQKVHVGATVESPEPDREGEIVININGYETYATIDDILHAEPAPLAVGDLVTLGGFANDKFTIVHIDGNAVFLKGAEHHYATSIANCRRAD